MRDTVPCVVFLPLGCTGTIVKDDMKRVEHWGACWHRYYKLDIEYFMSAQAKAVIAILSKNFLWMRTLGSTPMLSSEVCQHLGPSFVSPWLCSAWSPHPGVRCPWL